jgi:hypothetical protein
MFTDLVDLIEMPKGDTWSLIYKGTTHGFAASNFHSRCDGIQKTLVLIESANNYIFGGYTDIGWGSTNSGAFKYDPSAFIFSLTNPSNSPAKFKLKTGETNSIYWHYLYGPSFGYWDIKIESYPNSNGNNYINIGFSYNTTSIVKLLVTLRVF